MVTMITAEVEPLGGFVGDAFKLPGFSGRLSIGHSGVFVRPKLIMALAAVALYPLQGYLIPKLQRRVNLMGKERVRRVRELSASIGETAAVFRKFTRIIRPAENLQFFLVASVRYTTFVSRYTSGSSSSSLTTRSTSSVRSAFMLSAGG